jgi:RNA polymerase sigma-70 factor (ECF subfamily)
MLGPCNKTWIDKFSLSFLLILHENLPVLSDLISYHDNELVRLLLHDDRSAFDELYRRYWPILYNAAYKRLKTIEPSKDITQEVFIDLWLRRGKVEIENIQAYLLTAVRFQVLKLVSREKNITSFLEPFENMAISSFNADGEVIDKELADLFNSWLNTLPEKRKSIFVMHFIDKLTTKEIAERLNISQKTVQNQLGSSVQDLRKSINQYILSLLL